MGIERSLEHLRQLLPDPFRYPEVLDSFFELPEARSVVDGGTAASEELLDFLGKSNEPALVHVAMLLLTKADVAQIYSRLLGIIQHSDAATVLAMDAGFWRLPIDEATLAHDLVARSSPDHPNPLLLLQRPAASAVKDPLQEFARLDADPLSTFAMRCLMYASQVDDRNFLKDLQSSSNLPEVRELATEMLTDL